MDLPQMGGDQEIEGGDRGETGREGEGEEGKRGEGEGGGVTKEWRRAVPYLQALTPHKECRHYGLPAQNRKDNEIKMSPVGGTQLSNVPCHPLASLWTMPPLYLGPGPLWWEARFYVASCLSLQLALSGGGTLDVLWPSQKQYLQTPTLQGACLTTSPAPKGALVSGRAPSSKPPLLPVPLPLKLLASPSSGATGLSAGLLFPCPNSAQPLLAVPCVTCARLFLSFTVSNLFLEKH